MLLFLFAFLFFKNFNTFKISKYIIGKKKNHRLMINYQHVLSPGILKPLFHILLSFLLIGSLFCLLPPSLSFLEKCLYLLIYLFSVLIFINFCGTQLSCNRDWKKKSLCLDHHLNLHSFYCALSIVMLLKA